jgi:uncharacterized protein (TIGR03118 family)
MIRTRSHLALTALIGLALFWLAPAGTEYLPTAVAASAENKNDKVVVLETDLVADNPGLLDNNGIVHSPFIIDPHLVNPWGVAEGPSSPFWVADNGEGASTLYRVPDGSAAVSMVQMVFSIPSPGDPLGRTGTPTGAIFNTDIAGQRFRIVGVNKNGNAAAAPANFLFATEDGTIVGWNPGVNPSGFDPSKAGTYGIVAVDNSKNPTMADGAVYKGLAIATDAAGKTFLYATNFRAGTVEVYDDSFHPAPLPAGAFTDPHLPHDFAPFNIVLVGARLFVTYAKQDKAKHDDVAAPAHGIVDTFDLSGNMLARFTQHARLNSPWGVVRAPSSFGEFAGAILIGNFGDGRINAFDADTGDFLASVTNSLGQEILIDGLWTLTAGNGQNGGEPNAIYFTAGPNGEKHGLFGSLEPVLLGSPCGVPCR